MAEESLKLQTKKGILWTFFNQFANNGLQFVVGIIMARLLTPSDYGITALPAIFMAIAGVFIESGFGAAMVRKPELTEKDLSTAFIYSASVGVLCYVLIFLAAPWIADFYQVPVLVPLIRVTALSFLWGPLASPQTILLQRRLDFKTPARIAVTTKLIGAAIGVSAAYLGYGLWALVAMSVVSSFLTFIQLWIAVRWRPKASWSADSFRYLWSFGNKMVVSALLDKIYVNLTPLIVGKFFTTADLGVYNRAKSYAALPSEQGTNIIQQVTFPVLSKLQNDEEALAHGYRRMLKVSAFVIFPVMTILAALSKPFILLLITDKWVDAILLLQLICFSAMWYPVHAINLNLLQVKGRSDLFLKLEVWKKALGLVVMGCTLPFGLTYFVAAGILSSFVALFINTYYTGQLINVGFARQMRDLLPTYLLSIVVFALVYVLNLMIDNLWLQLTLGIVIGASVYVGCARMFRFSELADVKYMLNKK